MIASDLPRESRHAAAFYPRSSMRWLLIALCSICTAFAAELPDIEQAIPEPVKTLGPPAMMEFPGGIQMAVSAATDGAQAHVLQGLNHLHAGWEFEASRHFAAAMREDSECLLAHWGMLMTLLDPTPETLPARNATAERMLELINQKKGSELELGYAYGLVKFIEEGAAGAASAFQKVASRFPNDLQAAVLSALFNRGGFDAAGEATPDQERSEKALLALIEKHPNSPIPLNALLFIRAEGPNPSVSLENATKLSLMVPNYPPFIHMAGHYSWRSGNHTQAIAWFTNAAALYQKWMDEQSVTTADCPEWFKAECYRIVSLFSLGEDQAAHAAAVKLAATPLFTERPASAGNRFLMWEVKTLPARITLAQGDPNKAADALLSLPTPASLKPFHDDSLAYWWVDGLRFNLETRRLIANGELEEARNVLKALSQHGEMMATTQKSAASGGERSAWLRSFRALEALTSETRANFTIAGPAKQKSTAYNWFSAAADNQLTASLLMPPVFLTPMATRLGEYHLANRQTPEAIEAFKRGLALFAKDMTSLIGLKRAYETAGMSAEAAEISGKIEALNAQRAARQ